MTSLRNGPIIYVDDDVDDQLLFQEAIRELGLTNVVHSFSDGLEALHYLETTTDKPLLVLSDIAMPRMGGLELQQALDSSDYLRKKAIPFLFFTTAAGPDIVNQAYQGNLQGFHTKASTYPQLRQQLQLIITYWQTCLHPNSF